MATVTGTTLKTNAAISGSANINTASGVVTLYTAPANGYAIVQIGISHPASGFTTGTIYIAGRPFFSSVGSANLVQNGTFAYYVGPSQAVTGQYTAATAAIFYVVGVEFINSP
jgi:hypothetical protein